MFKKEKLIELTDYSLQISEKFDMVEFQKKFFMVFDPKLGRFKPYDPYLYQEAIAKDNSDHIVINKARQTGISTSTVMDAIYRCIIKPGHTVTFVSARQDQAEILINRARQMIANVRKPFTIKLVKNQSSLLEFKNGSRLKAVSANPSATRGITGDLVLDEFAHVPNDKAILEAALQTTVRGGLKIRMLSTPRGRQNMFYDIEQNAKNNENSPWSYHEIYCKECPDLDEERVMSRCPTHEIYLQEYCCTFVDEATAMFTFKLLDSRTDNSLEMFSLNHFVGSSNPIFIGIDPGEKVNDTGFTIAERVGRQWFIRYVLAEKMSKDRLVEYTKSWYRAVHPLKIYVDENGMGAPFVADLQKELGKVLVEGIFFSNTNKERLIYNLLGLFESGTITIPEDEDLKAQLHAVRRETTKNGSTRYSGKALGGSDDLVWSTALAVCHYMRNVGPLKVEVVQLNRKPLRRMSYGKYY